MTPRPFAVRLVAVSVAAFVLGSATLEARGAGLVQHPQTPPPAAAAPPPAPTPASQSNDLKATLQRIQERIDEELAKSPMPRPAARESRSGGPPVAQPKSPRIRLNWRVVLTWPEELAPPARPPIPLRLIWR